MNYENFRESLLSAIGRQSGKEVTYQTRFTKKNNGIYREYLFLQREDSLVSPAIGLEDIYEKVAGCGIDFEDLAGQILNCCRVETMDVQADMDAFMEFETARRGLYVRLINREMNRELLRELPYEEILDLALICYYHMKNEVIGEGTVLVDLHQMAAWGVSKEQLFSIARANTIHTRPASLMNLNDMLRMLDRSAFSKIEEEYPDPWSPLYVLTNDIRTFGAFVLFYPNLLSHVADTFNCSYYVLPSSIHETILLPDSGSYSPKDLKEMVINVNETQMDPREILSSSVYYYDREKKKLFIPGEGTYA